MKFLAYLFLLSKDFWSVSSVGFRQIFLLVFYFAVSNPLLAADLVVERAWLEDVGGQMGWEDVRGAQMQPFVGVINRGFSSAPLWIRVRVEPQGGLRQGAADESLVLRMRPAYLDRIEVFDPLAGGLIGILGDRQHPAQEAMRGLDFLLPIKRGTEARDLWLKLSTRSTRQIHVEVVRLSDLSTTQVRQTLLVSLYIGISLILMIWGWVSGHLQQEQALSNFGLMQLGSVLFGLSSLGVLHLLWPVWLGAEILDMAGSVFVIIAVTTGIWFHLRFVRIFQPAPWAMALLWGLFGLSLFNLALLVLGRVSLALQLNLVAVMGASVCNFIAALSTRAWRQTALAPPLAGPGFAKVWLVMLYGFLLLVLLITTTTGMGWLKATQWSIYISQIQGLLTSLLLLMMLQYRAYAQNQQRQQALVALESSRLQVLHEQRAREEQEKLLMMLAHEIKTPLATMHMRLDPEGQGNAAIRTAMRDMNEVIERCTQALRLEDGKLVVNPQVFDLADLVRNAVSSALHPERFDLSLPHELKLNTDPQLLFIAVNNLLENASKYAPPEARISLECIFLSEARMARLRICNPPGQAGRPDAGKLFRKYYRAPGAQRTSGTGLGLYLVQSLIRSLGGEVQYLPQDEMVCFELDIPLRTPRSQDALD